MPSISIFITLPDDGMQPGVALIFARHAILSSTDLSAIATHTELLAHVITLTSQSIPKYPPACFSLNVTSLAALQTMSMPSFTKAARHCEGCTPRRKVLLIVWHGEVVLNCFARHFMELMFCSLYMAQRRQPCFSARTMTTQAPNQFGRNR